MMREIRYTGRMNRDEHNRIIEDEEIPRGGIIRPAYPGYGNFPKQSSKDGS